MAAATSWLSEYTAALDARDAREQAQTKLINAYTKLADRAALLPHPDAARAGPDLAATETPSPPPAVPVRSSPGFPFRTRSPATKEDAAPAVAPTDALASIRADLASTQKSRAELQAQIKPLAAEVRQLNSTVATSAQRILALERDKVQLERRVRDRDDEIRGKAKLVEETQDEMVSLNLQLNMAEERRDKLERENGELVERWMVRMGREAEEMNERSKWS